MKFYSIGDFANLSERTYKCESCGVEIDRDKNASINLSRYKVS